MMNKKRAKIASYLNHSGNDHQNVDLNERFVNACENGDYPTVSRILALLPDFNIDIGDNLGRSALRLAVENEHLEVVLVLLEKSDSPKMKEALLLAIYLGHTQIAESILKHPKYKVLNEKKFGNNDSDSFWQTPSSDDAQFSPDITPLILASQYNRTEIVQRLVENFNERITKPHDYHCKCNECLNRFKFDSLRHAQSRLNAYRALASESYISFASQDPILTSFELAHELKMLSAKEKYFKAEYLQLADNLSSFTCKLLNNVRGRDELEIVLNKTGKEHEEKYERLARLDLALKYEEKPFVAHSNCQQKLVEIWYSGIRKVSKMNQVFVLLFIIGFVFTLPFNILIYMIAPKTKVGRFMNQPCIKFLSHTVSYVVFIIMLIVSSITFSEEQRNRQKFSKVFWNRIDNYTEYFSRSDFKYKFPLNDFYIRMDRPSHLDIAISIWVIGLFWHESKQIYHHGIKDYMRSWSNIVNSAMNILYIASFGLKYYTMILVHLNQLKISDSSFWFKLEHLNETSLDEQLDVYHTFYWMNDDRFYWMPMDPVNMAEGFFAIANILSFTRICFLMPANQQLGPLQISLGNMISDIVKFVFIFMIVFLAFVFALNNLFWYYPYATRKEVQTADDHRDLTNAETNFGTIGLSLKSMFWALFGLGDPKNVSLEPFQNTATEFFGMLLYGCYHIASIIVLLNMLVASMTQSYERILEESDVEWKFARSKLYMEYIRKGATLPVPFNIVPTPKSIFYVALKLVSIFRKNKPENTPERTPSGSQRPPDVVQPNNRPYGNQRNERKRPSNADGSPLTYKKVRERIVKRFSLYKQRETDEVGNVDFEELKQDLQMVRYEMLNDMKRAREETVRLISQIQAGVVLLGDEIFKGQDSETSRKFNEYKTYDHELSDNGLDEGNNLKDVNSNLHSPLHTKKHMHMSVSYPSILEASDFVKTKVCGLKMANDKKSPNDSNMNSLGSSMDTQSTGETGVTDPIQSNSSTLNGDLYDSGPRTSVLAENQIEFVVVSENAEKSNNELHVINEEEESSNASPNYPKHTSF